MRATRRRLLQLPLLAAVVGCTPDPTVHGTPVATPEPIVPTRSAEASAVATWVTEFAELIDVVSDSAADWGADDTQVAWLAALTSQSAAHLSRVVTESPVTGGSTAFPVPDSTSAALPAPATPEEALSSITTKVTAGTPVMQTALASASNGSERLFHASIAAAVSGSLNPALPPADGGAEPAPFPDPDMPGSLGVALGHVWALIRGLELGLGKLDRSDDLREAGTQRLDSARVLRNTLLAALDGEPPEVETWELPNPMSAPDEIRSAWAVLEANMLDALGVLVAADGPGSAGWLESMLGQVPWVHRWGGRLPHWPGWVATK